MKEVDTVVNKQYVVSSAGACTVNAVLPSGGTLELVSTQGGQAGFVAVSGSVQVSDDAALVSGPFDKAPASLGSGGGSAPAPAPVPEPLFTHAAAAWDIPEGPFMAIYVQVLDAAGQTLVNDAFGYADTPEELVAGLNGIEGMSGVLRFAADGQRLIVTAVAPGDAGNGIGFFLYSTQPPFPRAELTLSGGAAAGALKHGHVYLATATDGLDLSAVTVEEYGTCELWIDYVSGPVTWPPIHWLNGTVPPAMDAAGRYRYVLRMDGTTLVCNMAYSIQSVS